mgnify:FL=1
MALGFVVHGPTKVLFNTAAGTTAPANVLGYTDNNDLISLDMEYPQEPIFTTRSGSIPEAYIHLGLIGRLTMTLVKWDAGILETLMYALPGDADTEADVGTIGGVKTTGKGNFSLRISGISSNIAYTMQNCYLDGSIRRMDFGNRPSRIGLNFICLPHEATPGTLAATDEVYDIGTP